MRRLVRAAAFLVPFQLIQANFFRSRHVPPSRLCPVRGWAQIVGTALVVVFVPLPAAATIRYRISLAQPEEHLFRITMIVPDVADQLVVQLPGWNALYQIRDFAHHVQHVHASDGSHDSLRVAKQDKQTWLVRGTGIITLDYAAYWDEPSPFSSQLDRAHAFLNLATILFYVPERRGEDVRVEFSDIPRGWKIAVALAVAENTATLLAPSYDALVDAPVEIGAFEEFRVEVAGARTRVVVHGKGWNRAALREAVERIVAYQTGMMRDVPFPEYLFIYHFGQGGSGSGMEHANSTAIYLDAGGVPDNVTAHEFFHLWNVKRIRPQSLEPVDYTREQWTPALWFAEGVTDTYAAYTLVRTGLWSREQFYADLAQQISELESRPARNWKSVEEASLDAWLERYAAYRGTAFSISYYNKGQILGVLLDILIRDASNNRATLDDVLRFLNENFARRGRFYNDSADLRAAVRAVLRQDASSQSGLPSGPDAATWNEMEEFFSRYVSGTDELPCRKFLARAGLVLKPMKLPRADFGFRAERGPNGVSVATRLEPGSAAEKAGLREGDVLLEINKAPFLRDPENWLRDQRPGEKVHLRLRRDAEELEVSFPLGQRQERGYAIEEERNSDDKQRRIREGLLRGTTESVPQAVLLLPIGGTGACPERSRRVLAVLWSARLAAL